MSGGGVNAIEFPTLSVEHHHFHHGEQEALIGPFGAKAKALLKKAKDVKNLKADDLLTGAIAVGKKVGNSETAQKAKTALAEKGTKFAKDVVNKATTPKA
jgi:hypothetical protein